MLPGSITEALRKLSRTEGVTLFMTLLAGFQALLGWVSGRQDVVLGSNVANRNHSLTEGLIGFFANLLVLRTDLAGDPSFVELLARVREVALGAYAHQDVPFDKLVEDLQPKRDPSYSPIVQVVFSFQNVPTAAPAPGPLAMTPLPSRRATAKFDLVLDMAERGSGLGGMFEYSTDLFTADTVARLAAQYEALLQAAVVRPGLALSEIYHLVAEAERERRATAANRFEREDAQALAGLRRSALRGVEVRRSGAEGLSPRVRND
jgi:non-ribosomal peptide synthetase component F